MQFTTLNILKYGSGDLVTSHVQLFVTHDCSPPGSSVYGISQARVLEWVAISFSRGSSWPWNQTWASCLAGRFFTTESPEIPILK